MYCQADLNFDSHLLSFALRRVKAIHENFLEAKINKRKKMASLKHVLIMWQIFFFFFLNIHFLKRPITSLGSTSRDVVYNRLEIVFQLKNATHKINVCAVASKYRTQVNKTVSYSPEKTKLYTQFQVNKKKMVETELFCFSFRRLLIKRGRWYFQVIKKRHSWQF